MHALIFRPHSFVHNCNSLLPVEGARGLLERTNSSIDSFDSLPVLHTNSSMFVRLCHKHGKPVGILVIGYTYYASAIDRSTPTKECHIHPSSRKTNETNEPTPVRDLRDHPDGRFCPSVTFVHLRTWIELSFARNPSVRYRRTRPSGPIESNGGRGRCPSVEQDSLTRNRARDSMIS